jgi:hypothetical protein
MAQSGHRSIVQQCPLLGVKRTCLRDLNEIRPASRPDGLTQLNVYALMKVVVFIPVTGRPIFLAERPKPSDKSRPGFFNGSHGKPPER